MRGPSAETENSIATVARFRMARRRREALARALPAAPMLAGAALLAAAEPTTLRSVRVGGRTVETLSAGAHHGWALALVALALAVLAALVTARGSRPAAAAAVLVAAIALWIVLGIDRPALHESGLVGGRLASAQTGPAWRLELVGAIVAMVGAIGVFAASAVAERRH
jgi:hypothetical protein